MINQEEHYDNFTTLLRRVLRKWSRSVLHTARPGIIETYDPEKKRARVRAALYTVLSGEVPGELGETLEGAVSVNVPVIFPAGGGLGMTFPLREGDAIMLFFSERGLTEFKKTYELSMPDRTRFFSESDAVAYAGFGALEITPASDVGATLQTEDGQTFVEVEPELIRLKHLDTEVTVESDNVTIVADRVNVGGRSGKRLINEELRTLFNTHTHGAGPPPTQQLTVQGHMTDKTRAE